jgi:hypothetical protein
VPALQKDVFDGGVLRDALPDAFWESLEAPPQMRQMKIISQTTTGKSRRRSAAVYGGIRFAKYGNSGI